jgi:hypothetical protein
VKVPIAAIVLVLLVATEAIAAAGDDGRGKEHVRVSTSSPHLRHYVHQANTNIGFFDIEISDLTISPAVVMARGKTDVGSAARAQDCRCVLG